MLKLLERLGKLIKQENNTNFVSFEFALLNMDHIPQLKYDKKQQNIYFKTTQNFYAAFPYPPTKACDAIKKYDFETDKYRKQCCEQL